MVFLILVLFASPTAWASDWISGFGASLSTSDSSQSTGVGLGLNVKLGDPKDHTNVTGAAHFKYAILDALIDPANPSAPQIPLHHYTGGMSVFPWKKTFFGIDLDNVSDKGDSLYANGITISAGYGLFKLSYQYNKVTSEIPTAPIFQGAFALHHLFGIDGGFDIGSQDQLSLGVSASLFGPDPSAFYNFLAQHAVTRPVVLESTLGGFQFYSVRAKWKRNWTESFYSDFGGRFGRLAVNPGICFGVDASMGFRVSEMFGAGLAWAYTYGPLLNDNSIKLRVSFNWEPPRSAP